MQTDADVAQLVEQLICNQLVGGSIPSIGSERKIENGEWRMENGNTHTHFGEIPERSNGADCKSVGEAFGGSNPPLPTRPGAKCQVSSAKKSTLYTSHFTLDHAEVAHLVERKPSKLQVAGSSPVFRSNSHPHPLRRCSSVVEHFLGKEGVMSSTLIIGSTSIHKKSKL
jgi:hypothetical protein